MSEQEFDESEYLAANPDVAAAVKNGQFKSGLVHFETFGKKEGRMKKFFGQMSREDKVLCSLDKNGLGLEIGPSHNPIAPKGKGFNVQILDHLSADDLRKKYADHANYGVNIEKIEEVDFVWAGQTFTQLIGREAYYDWIIASHVIEHVPDLVSFFQQCEALLKPEGRLALIIPDKRYCFDYFNETSSTGEILDAFEEKRTCPSVGKVFDHFSNACKRNGKIAWSTSEGGGGSELIHSSAQAFSLWQQSRSSKDYIDVHCWRFTPESFRLVLCDLNMLELTNMEIINEFETSGCEFFVTLSKKRNVQKPYDRLSMLQKIKSSNY